jgi:hypothetical protein
MTSETKMAHSFLWLAAIQPIERKHDSVDLAPKRSFVPAESIECGSGQIGQPQKALRELDGRTATFQTAGSNRPNSV